MRARALLRAAALVGAAVEAKLVRPGLEPIRGWTSWDLSALKDTPPYGPTWLTENNVLRQSAALAARSDLQRSGFAHINIDAFWSMDPTRFVDQYGRWATNATRFPSGLAALSNTIHSRGQKLGIYLNPGLPPAAYWAKSAVENSSCTADQIVLKDGSGNPVRGNPFGDGFAIDWDGPAAQCAQKWVQSFANLLVHDWGIDFLKMDAVTPGSANGNATTWPDGQWNSYDNSRDVREWSTALERTGRDVWLAISWEIDPDFATELVPAANSWRTSMDIDCYCDVLVKWPAVRRVFAQVRPWVSHSGNDRAHGRPDLDSLNLGNGGQPWGMGLTPSEQRVYATFWAMVGAPTYTGVDLERLDAAGAAMLASPKLHAINRHQITAVPDDAVINGSNSSHWELQTWVTDYTNGTMLVGLFNLDDTNRTMRWIAPRPFTAVDVWADAPFPCPLCRETGKTGSINILPHSCLLLRLTLI